MSSKIRSVIIVDDEFRIGQLIRQLIHWDTLNMKCQDVLSDGETALEEILSNTPDIVLTDIRMPKIDGLDLIKATKDKGLNVCFIVVSGYKDFEYAHKALEYGIDDYLIKPVNENQLNDVLQKINNKLNDNDLQNENQQKMNATVKESERIMKKDVWNQILDNKDPESSTYNNLNVKDSIYQVIDIKLDSIEAAHDDAQQDRFVANSVCSNVEEILTDAVDELIVTSKPGLHIYCIIRYSSKSIDKINQLVSYYQDLKEKINMLDQYYVTIGVGRQHKFCDIRDSISEAYQAVCNRMTLGTDKIIFSDELPPFSDFQIKEYLAEARDTIHRCVVQNSKDALLHYISMLYYNINEKQTDCTVCYSIADQLFSIFLNDIQTDFENIEKDKLKLYIKCQNCNHKAALVQTLKDGFSEYFDLIQIHEHKETIKPIRITKDFIESHYSEKITLDDMANKVGLSSAYFSALFKKETGTNLFNYINEIRIEHAKQLLQTSDESIAAIADMVGYTDERYFSKTFHKTTGIKPALFRKLHS